MYACNECDTELVPEEAVSGRDGETVTVLVCKNKDCINYDEIVEIDYYNKGDEE